MRRGLEEGKGNALAKVCWEELKEWEKTGRRDQSEKRREGNFLGKGE